MFTCKLYISSGGTKGKEPACQCRRHKRNGFDSWLGRSPGGGHGYPLQYSCLDNPMDRGAWRATVHGVTNSQTRLKWLSMHTHNSLWKLFVYFINIYRNRKFKEWDKNEAFTIFFPPNSQCTVLSTLWVCVLFWKYLQEKTETRMRRIMSCLYTALESIQIMRAPMTEDLLQLKMLAFCPFWNL